MKHIMSGKRGSYTVFIAIFMSGMIIMAGAVIYASHRMAIDSAAEDLGNLWANSIIGEYDIKLRERYGFYGYYGNGDMVREKLDSYADYTFRGKKYIKRSEISCDLENYRLSDPDVFRDQMGKIILSLWKPIPFEDDEPSDISEGTVSNDTVRYISSGWILEGLPSHSRSKKVSGGGMSLMETAYIFKSFKDHVDDRDLGKTYFKNEIEYIITGKPDDEKARKGVYLRLLGERNALNLAYLYGSPEKRNAALEAAELITPGPQAFVTQAVILEVWALLESRNDIELLYDGERVPLVKGDDNWALGLESAVEKVSDDEEEGELDTRETRKYVRPKSIEGLKYSDYLKSILITVPENKRLLRVMDLIQINMKFAYCDYFLLDDYYTGLDYSMTVNGTKHDYHAKYD